MRAKDGAVVKKKNRYFVKKKKNEKKNKQLKQKREGRGEKKWRHSYFSKPQVAAFDALNTPNGPVVERGKKRRNPLH